MSLPCALCAAASAKPLQPLPVKAVGVEGGFWGHRVTTNAEVTLPHNLGFLEKSGRLPNFDRAAGKDSTPHVGNAAHDSDVFKTIEGAAYTLQLRPDDVDAGEIARHVSRITAARQDDGFLCTKFIVNQHEARWNDLRTSHLLYSAGHLFEAGVAWREASGKSDLLDASQRYADLIDGRYGPGKIHDVEGHQEIELALVKLHQATGEQRYLDLSRFFLEERGHIHGGRERVRGEKPRADDYNQDRVPLAEAEHAVGHVVRAGYTYAAMADIAAHGHDGFDKALDRLWKDVLGSKYYITGASATAQYYDEGYGDPFFLPNDTAYSETCASIAFVLWAQRMAMLRADASYVDALERTLYNGVLSGISISGDRFFYTNPLASRGGKRRHESFDPACCQTNLVRVIPQVGSMAYATDDNAIYVNLFVSGTASIDHAKGELLLRQETDYPHDGRIRITVESAIKEPFTIAMRIPGWAREQPVPSGLYRFAETSETPPRLTVNGETRPLDALERGYARLTRAWRAGDVIELDLPMPVRRVLADERVEANRGRVALQRGPLVYCVESVDHDGIRTDALVLPDDAALQTEHRKNLLGGVVVVTAKGGAVREPAWGKPLETVPQEIKAVPYYAWCNRGDGYMDVWLPRTAEHATPLPAATAGADATVTASVKRPNDQHEALRDRRSGPVSNERHTPRFSFPDQADGRGWIQYEWPEPRNLSRAAVYWAVDSRQKVYWSERIRGEDLKLPESWRLLYRDGGDWKPVTARNLFPPAPDRFNEESFTPVKTTALRLEVDFADAPCGIQEWIVD